MADDVFLDPSESDPVFDLDASIPEIEDSFLLKRANALLKEAIEAKASFVHFEPNADDTRVLFRVEGSLREHDRIPATERRGIATRLKLMAYLDITERRRPQSGLMHLKMGGRHVDFLLTTLPTVHKEERLVLRAWYGPEAIRPLRDMGLDQKLVDQWKAIFGAREGLYVIAGKSRSGKTYTLYSTLLGLRGEGTVILSAEPSVQMKLPGITQTEMSPMIGVTGAGLVKAFLAHDANVFAIDGVATGETAEAALEGAVKGHQVILTLYAPGAAEALTRFLDMGLPGYLLGGLTRGVLGLRTLRALCKECRKAETVPQETRSRYGLGSVSLYKAGGCPRCGGTGYRGELQVGELLTPDEEIRDALKRGIDTRSLQALARKHGMIPLVDAAMAKVSQGETTLAEVLSVFGPL